MANNENSNQDVSTALELLKGTLAEEKQRIYAVGTNAMKQYDAPTARAVLDFADKLEVFRTNVQDLVKKWEELQQIRDSAAPEVQEIVTGEGRLFAAKPRKSSTGFTRTITHPLAPKTKFRVTFPDLSVIEETKATETLAKTIDKIGVERVLGLGLILNGEPFISETPSQKYPSASKKIEKYFVSTHSSTSSKVSTLKKIMKLLSIDAKIEVIKP